ncbi:uroporphyrinogen decarboxylase family protein [Novipirellula artificiosorum]|uniref:Methylcobalamin:coenzyme M methyltransferase n=1 Tax=Novipirellula artificiosorum TaxID=2528016 RepID=A0A5C6DC14_9BACT|nr:uroporphyrinogen decarboxylase family protein [Novipirellula artificiosorum]TWU34300.1 methylcobalamin:coenzyme M methyltransferase [Novipirellula artificiosorum]
MDGRQRLDATLNHRQPDRVCVDFGATFVTGVHVAVVDKLRKAVLGDPEYRVRVIEPYQMLGEIDDELRDALGIDVVGHLTRKSIFGTDESDWKPFTMFDGCKVLVPHNFNTTVEPGSGDLLIYPEGDRSCAPSGRMPKGGYFFDSIIRQHPIDEATLDPNDNLEEFKRFDQQDVAFYQQVKHWFDQRSQAGSIVIVPGSAMGDIALVPAPFLKDPKGIRDIAEWYMSTAMRTDYVHAIFEKQCEIALENIRQMIDILGDSVQSAVITGTDFGMQTGAMISNASYRDLFQPYHKKINDLIHRESNWKTFIHSCGSVWTLIPDFIEAGFDILNPVQCSAAEMDPRRLKATFGNDIVFWGGGVDTQKTLAFGTPDEVYNEVRERIEIFNDGGGFVFNAIHNVQGNVSIENVRAMFNAIHDS